MKNLLEDLGGRWYTYIKESSGYRVDTNCAQVGFCGDIAQLGEHLLDV